MASEPQEIFHPKIAKDVELQEKQNPQDHVTKEETELESKGELNSAQEIPDTKASNATVDDSKVQEGHEQAEAQPPYSVFGSHERRFIIVLASLAALFSPLSANIYFPALNTLARDLDVSISKINLTITTYLIFQGLAPSFIGSLSDESGRRPAYMICFVIYIGANIGLALLQNYPSLLILRMLQSSGSSGTVALANAVVSDVATSAERGTAMGYAQMGALVGPAFGPLIGGLLNQFLGWRAIFWFLVIFSGVTFLILLIGLPETCRKVVDNGSIPTYTWNMSLLSYLHLRRQRRAGTLPQQQSRLRFRARFNPFKTAYILVQKESGLLIFYSGIMFSGLYMVFSSIPPQFAEKYNFNTLQIGLCYISTGVGGMLAAFGTGKVLDWNFRRHAKLIGMELVDKKQQDLTNFPIEAARLQITLPLIYLSAATVIGYGWVTTSHTSLAGPVIFLFLSSFGTIGSFTSLSTLVIDLNRANVGTASAAMNLERCWMGAGAVAFVEPLLKAVGLGWTSVIVAGAWVCISPVTLVIIKYGPQWRRERQKREDERKFEKEAAQRALTGNEDGTLEANVKDA